MVIFKVICRQQKKSATECGVWVTITHIALAFEILSLKISVSKDFTIREVTMKSTK